MIVRIWIVSGVLLTGLAWLLMVPLSPAPFQASPGGNIAGYRAQGLVPRPGGFTLSRVIGHEVFEVPEEDVLHRGEETAMEGMAMGDAQEGGQKEGEHAEQPMPGMAMGGAKEAEHAEGAMPGMEKEFEHVEQPMPGMAMGEMEEGGLGGGHGGGGLMVMPAEMARMAVRRVEIEMNEWGFSPAKLTVKPGEVIHFTLRNRGSLPHEFMFMTPEQMSAVNYRLQRADWNLTEHEASFERALVLPGDSFETVIKVERPGTWMFMCMFPYHMQFGMMGVMMTEGASVEGGMGGMKM